MTLAEQLDREAEAITQKRTALSWQPKSNHTDAEKIVAFDRLHAFALSYIEAVRADERFKDVHYQAYENLMAETVAHEKHGTDVWKFINTFDRDDS